MFIELLFLELQLLVIQYSFNAAREQNVAFVLFRDFFGELLLDLVAFWSSLLHYTHPTPTLLLVLNANTVFVMSCLLFNMYLENTGTFRPVIFRLTTLFCPQMG